MGPLHSGTVPAPSQAAGRGLRERWLGWRDRLLASPSFRAGAARFPLTRWIARRRARAVFDLVAGFVYSQVLLACVKLRMFELLAEGPRRLDDIARRTGLDGDAASRLLSAAVALRLVERRGGDRFGLGVLGAPLAGNAGLAAMIEHHEMLYADLGDPVALLRGDARAPSRLAAYWPYAGAVEPATAEAAEVSAYSQLMSASQPLVAGEILAAYPLGRHRAVLDVGGGEGTFLIAAGEKLPRLGLILFDLPAVAERAKQRFTAAGMGARADAIGGSFLHDALPRGADIVTLVRVLHDHDDASVATLLAAVHAALPAGGTVLVAEPMAETPGAEPMGDAYFGFYLLAMGRGRPRSSARLTAMLAAAGFIDMRLRATRLPLQTQLLVANKPSRKP